MKKNEAKELIRWWFDLPKNQKDRNWNKVYNIMNQFPEIYKEEREKRYDKKAIKQINLRLNIKTDADVLKKLDLEENKQGCIKGLIRKDIK